MEVVAIIISIIDILICLALIGLVILQEGHSKGLGIIGGGAETFLGKSKGRTIDAKLKRFTTVAAIAFAVLTIVLHLLPGR